MQTRHGGAWKVAYADFVTALLALFIVLWMMNSSVKVKESVQGYFRDPMGFKLRGVIRCGRCGKPRAVRHVCITTRTRKRRHKLQNPVTWECGTCHKARGLRHTCSQRSDFKARRRRQAAAERRRKRRAAAAARAARRRQAAADRRARDRARKQAAKTRPRTSRPRGESHEPGTCGNRDCPKYGCKAYWAGMDNCPGPHEGD